MAAMKEPTKPRLLIVDDDRELTGMLADYLIPEGFEVETLDDAAGALERLDRDDSPDLVVLDVMLPGMSGLDVLRRLRERSRLPVIMLTARGDDVDRIVGLELGADDYLPKPFVPRELVARIRAILRRATAAQAPGAALEFRGIRLEPAARVARRGGRDLELTSSEFEILRLLLASPGEVVSKERLTEEALGRRLLPFDRSVDTHISNLRAKLRGDDEDEPPLIRNVRGVGYVLVAESGKPGTGDA